MELFKEKTTCVCRSECPQSANTTILSWLYPRNINSVCPEVVMIVLAAHVDITEDMCMVSIPHVPEEHQCAKKYASATHVAEIIAIGS